MTLRLVIDTTGPVCAAGFFDATLPLATLSEDLGRGHAERLVPMLEEVRAQAGLEWSELEGIVVTTGPGSFTGMRVGLATARGLALALGLEACGVGVLDALARGIDADGPFTIVLDAKRGQVWHRSYDATGAPLCEPEASAADGLANFDAPHPVPAHPTTASLAHILAVALDTPPVPPVPLYLRGADAKRATPRPVRA